MLDVPTVGLTDRFEPDATAKHLANVEKFLTCQQEDVSYIVSIYKKDINGTPLTLRRDLLMDRTMSVGSTLKTFEDVIELLKRGESIRDLT